MTRDEKQDILDSMIAIATGHCADCDPDDCRICLLCEMDSLYDAGYRKVDVDNHPSLNSREVRRD